MSLKGRTVFISGGSRGTRAGHRAAGGRRRRNIVIAAKTAEPNPKLPGTIHSAAREIEQAGGACLPVQADIRDEGQVLEAVRLGAERFGGIDIVVNNASAIGLTGTESTPDQAIRPDARCERPGHVSVHAGLPAAPETLGAAGAQSARADAVAAAEPEAAMVRPARGLLDRQVRNELVRAGPCRGTAPVRHRRERVVAQNGDPDRRVGDDSGRAPGAVPAARRSLPMRRTRSCARTRGRPPATFSWTRTCCARPASATSMPMPSCRARATCCPICSSDRFRPWPPRSRRWAGNRKTALPPAAARS